MELLAKILPWVQIVLSVLLVGAILLQRSGAETGGALGSGSDGISSLYHTKRGLEKVLFNATILIALLFAVSAFIALVIK
jgi:preprotein translocase subunit SecG